MPASDDWRLRGQDRYLLGATLVRKHYQKADHDHCEFCWRKFMDPDSSPRHAQFVRENPEILSEGYAVQGGMTIHGILDDYWWICPACVDDFRHRFKWIVSEVPH